MIYSILPPKAEEGWIKPDQCQVNSTWIELTYYIETLIFWLTYWIKGASDAKSVFGISNSLFLECKCNIDGSTNGNVCNKFSGECSCKHGWTGMHCELPGSLQFSVYFHFHS